jgi:phosphoribosyl-AMP cyclohydrolase
MSTSGWSWYHGTFTTYGAWLPGDPRGFRTRHHRQHVDGDHKHPPKTGEYDGLKQACRAALTQSVVTIAPELRSVVGRAVLQRLQDLGGMVVAISVDAEHVHVLAKMPILRSKLWIGLAKKHAWFQLRDGGWRGKLWSKGSQAELVRDRRHQLNVHRYILRHASHGAWVWKWGDTIEPPSPPAAAGGN